MIRPHLPLNNLRAFEVAARHLSFTNAATELRVTPAALSHQVKALEERLGFTLFRRLPRGLSLTDEGSAMLPVLKDCFDRIAELLEHVDERDRREIVTIGVIGTFAVCWLFPHLEEFEAANPHIDLRITTHNNRVDLAEEGMDFGIRFGDGAWQGAEADILATPRWTPLCSPQVAARIREPQDLLKERLLRAYRIEDWRQWFAKAGVRVSTVHGPVFDSAKLMIDIAASGTGVALGSPEIFRKELAAGQLVQPFETDVTLGSYCLTYLKSRRLSPAMAAFRDWVLAASAADRSGS